MMFLLAKLTKEIIFVCTIFLFIYVVCPAKLDHTSRCKSGHGNRQ